MFGIPNLYVMIGAGVLALSLLGGAYLKGDADAAHRYQAKIATMQAQAVEQVRKIRDANQAQANAAIATLESQNAQARVVYKTITQQVDKIVERPVYRDSVCLDPDGLVLVNAAIAGITVAPAASGEPRSLMPNADPAH